MTITITKKVLTSLLTLLIGFALGVTGTMTSNAEGPVPAVQGEMLKVCIKLKTGVIRVSDKCDAKTERKSVLGGAGAQGVQGAKGDKGDTGPVGSQGPVGQKGEPGINGSIPNLKIETIYYLGGTSCRFTNGSYEYVSKVYQSPFTNNVTGVSNGVLRLCYTTVYTP